MSHLSKVGRFLTIKHALGHHRRTRTGRSERKQSVPRCAVLLERLEERVTPSILGTFELDGNATTGVLGTSGSTTTSHDWDQVFAGTSGAIANGFLTDKVSSNTDDIFTGGGSKDILGPPPNRGRLEPAGTPLSSD